MIDPYIDSIFEQSKKQIISPTSKNPFVKSLRPLGSLLEVSIPF